MFGQTGNTSFGGFNAATQSSPFGQSAFGKPISTTSFGTGSTPVFGSNNTSLFSAKPTGAATGGLFGNTPAAPTFGQPATTQSTFGAFGANTSNTGLFGAQQNANSNLFGTGATTSAFGQANKPAGFGFGATTGNSLFGQPQQAVQQTTPFGQPNAAANTSLFGSGGGFRSNTTTTGTTGTMTKFNPVNGSDTMVKNGVTQNISTRHYCIMCMKEYENKSLEELRLEDYTLGLKGPAQPGQTTSLFGVPPQQSPFANTGTITSTVPSGFAAMGTGFATNQTTTSGGMFGKPVTGFGVPTTTTSAFAFNPTTSSSLFASNTQAKPFGNTQYSGVTLLDHRQVVSDDLPRALQKSHEFKDAAPQTTLFANTNTAQPAATGFGVMPGTQNTGFANFGVTQPNQSIGLFNQNKSAFNMATSNSGFVNYGQTAPVNTGTSVFAQKPIGTTGFGIPTTFATGAAPSFAAGTGFGITPNTSTSLFNSSLKPAGQTTGFSFSNTAASSSGLGTNTGLTLGGGGSLFAQQKPGGLFSSGTTGTTFNSTGTFGPTTGFGPGTGLAPGLGMNLLGGGIGSNQAQQNPSSVPVHQQILALVSAPFGDSPLLKNLLPASGKAEELLKPANPASKSLNGSQYKVSTNNNSPKIKARVVTAVQLSKKSLFEGLEEEDPTLLEAFQPRPNAKRLVLRPKSLSSATSSGTDDNVNVTRNNDVRDDSIDASTSTGNETEATNKENQQQASRRRSSSASWLVRRETFKKLDDQRFNNADSPQETLESTVVIFGSDNGGKTQSPGQTSPTANVSLNCSLGADKSGGDSPGISNDSSHDLDESPLSMLQQQDCEPNWSKVTLRRVGYYTIPSIEQLNDYVRGETCVVRNFTIGRKGYGNVYFPDSFDVYGLNLDEIVHFRHKEVIIYPDDEKKPPVGQELNRRAQVTLERVWPHDKSYHEPITDPYRLTAMNYEGKLRRVSAKHDTRFLEYRPETGSWVFKVDHFSKYGLSDSDDDDTEPSIDAKAKRLEALSMTTAGNPIRRRKSGSKVPPAATNVDKEPSNGPNGTVNGRASNLDKTASFHEDDESELNDTMSLKDFNVEKQGSALSPTSLYARVIGTDSHKLQLMKASFFDDDDFDDVPMHEVIQSTFKTHFKSGEIKEESHRPQPTYFPTLRSNLTLHSQLPFASTKDSAYESADIKVKQPMDLASEKPLGVGKSVPPPIVNPTTVVLKFRGEVIPLKQSVCSKLKFRCIADMGIHMGRTFKPSWGPGLTLVSLSSQEQAAVVPLHNTFSQIETYVSGRLLDDTTSTSIVQRLRILGGTGADCEHVETFRESIEDHLRIQLNHCVMGQEGDCPVIGASSGDFALAALHAHASKAQKLADDALSDRLSFYACDVWRLCVALWGNSPELQPNADKEKHETVMVRREAFGEWLRAVVDETVQREITDITGEDRLMLSLLSANKLEEACEQARKCGDYTLALLMSQLGGPSSVKELLKQTIALWQATNVVADISMCRLKLYMLVAGEQLISCRDDVINVCENLDWKRALAVHLWYLSPSTASITDVLDIYEAAFNGAVSNVYAAAPLPDYKDEDYDAEITSGKKTYDLCYHLMKLYSTGDHPLEELLNPLTHTADPLDYRLSWLVQQVIVGLGYSHLSEHVAALTHANFAAQLEAYDLWHWAIFVVMHLRDTGRRRKAVLDLLSRHVEIDEDADYVKREEFLKEELGIPYMWINEAKAVKGCAMRRYGEAAWYLIQAELWNKAHEVIIEHLAADAIINENYEYLRSLLSPLVPAECNTLVNGWAHQGQLLWDYMAVAVEIESFLTNRDCSEIGYKLELLQPQLTSLCTKINHFPCPTAKLRLCQAEIAKRTLHLARSLLLLQPNENRSTSRVLVHLVSQLPLPEDYAQQELRPIINMCVNEIVSH